MCTVAELSLEGSLRQTQPWVYFRFFETYSISSVSGNVGFEAFGILSICITPFTHNSSRMRM